MITFLIINIISIVFYMLFSIKHSMAPYYAYRSVGHYGYESVSNHAYEVPIGISTLAFLATSILLGIKAHSLLIPWMKWYLIGAVIALVVGTLIDTKIGDKVSVIFAGLLAVGLCFFLL